MLITTKTLVTAVTKDILVAFNRVQLYRRRLFTYIPYNTRNNRTSCTSTIKYRTELSYTTEQRGCLYDESFRLYIKNDKGSVISPFHDVPLETPVGKNIYNMVVEAPRWSNAKMEISTSEKMNPIKQDMRNGRLRFVANCFPHKGYLWNYGALPQTWEDPKHLDSQTGAKGDSDPIDVCDIGSIIHPTGSIIQVKVLGVLALIDEGETDWKIIAIDARDPVANELDDIHDVEKAMPGLLEATIHWYKIYKTPFGHPPNIFAFNGDVKDVQFTRKVVEQGHEQWKNLMLSASSHLCIDRSCTVFDGPAKILGTEAEFAVQKHPIKGDPKEFDIDVNKWHYVL